GQQVGADDAQAVADLLYGVDRRQVYAFPGARPHVDVPAVARDVPDFEHVLRLVFHLQRRTEGVGTADETVRFVRGLRRALEGHDAVQAFNQRRNVERNTAFGRPLLMVVVIPGESADDGGSVRRHGAYLDV